MMDIQNIVDREIESSDVLEDLFEAKKTRKRIVKDHAESSFLKLNDVLKIIPMSRSSLYLLIQDGRFPKPIKIGKRSVFWIAKEVDDFINKVISRGNNGDMK